MKSKLTTTLYLILSLLALPLMAHGQNINSELDSIRKTYSAMKNCVVELEYKLFRNYNSSVCLESSRSLMKRQGDQYYYKIAGSESIVNEDYILIVSHKNKTLMIDKYRKPTVQNGKKMNTTAMDTLLSKLIATVQSKDTTRNQITEKVNSKTEKQVTISYPHGDYKSVAFVFDRNTYLIKKSILYFRKEMQMDTKQAEAPRIEIVYTNTQQTPKFTKDTFSEKKFVTVLKSGNVQLSPALASYAVINHLKKQ
jgi:hypothetical protein